MKKVLFSFICLFAFLPIFNAEEDLAPNSKSAILIEASTGQILFEKNSDEQLKPASMTKIMSMLLIMEAIDSGKLSLEDSVMISKNASSMGGSQIFLQEGETYKVSELLKGIAIASGNDAVIALSEKVGGSVDNFVKMMNDRAKSLGLTNTHFVNPHGLDAEDHYSSARDMSIMGRELLKHEKILEFTSIYEDYLKKPDGSSTWLVNTNKLVRFYNGADGLKTGFTEGAGYCVTTTAKRNDMRILSVVMGVETPDKRSSDTTNLLNYGFNTYQVQSILKKGDVLGSTKVLGGKKENVDVVLLEDITEIIQVNEENKTYTHEVNINEISAPVHYGDIVGQVIVYDQNGKEVAKEDITVAEDVEKASIWDLFGRNLRFFTSFA
ncbi:MAG: D-alanyl-D-alanine carboxypeptidase [Bacilli bacterium]|nr:D-alanyl-D-alanine carboxypeptidase [Bacilli bacterium]